jgi:phage-related protein
MLPISAIVATEKNKLISDGVWLILLEITIPSVEETIRVVNNNEDITWNSNLWQKFNFDINEISETSNAEISNFQIKVSNINNVIGQYIRQYHAFLKTNAHESITCKLYLVNNKDLANTTPVYSTNLVLNISSVIFYEAAFTVSAIDTYRKQTPNYRMYPNNCRFKFKSTECGYSGEVASCDKSLVTCQGLNNATRYGGFPTIGNKSVSI